MLSNTFGNIVRNAVQEIQYRRAVICYMGVKADSIFAYWPPFNILALVIFLPMKLFISSRTFHRVNVFCIRVINLPLLLFLAWYERRTMWSSHNHRPGHPPSRIDWHAVGGPRATNKKSSWLDAFISFWDFAKFNVHGDIQAVFDIEPQQEVLDSIHEWTFGEGRVANNAAVTFAEQFKRPSMARRKSSAISKSRRKSTKVTKPANRRNSSDRLKQEFPDNASDASSDAAAPEGHYRPKRGARIDSLIDFSDNNAGLQEANARLNKIEQTVVRLEELMVQILEQADEEEGEGDASGALDDDGHSSHDSEQAENELLQGAR